MCACIMANQASKTHTEHSLYLAALIQMDKSQSYYSLSAASSSE